MKELSRQLAGIRKSDTPEILEQARQLIIRLQGMNRRWNIDGLEQFLRKRQKELFFSFPSHYSPGQLNEVETE
ncbi:MAG: hypothetical protein C0403_12285 [Desulfobacterium sp.]|nr:hypothetical protein [Desulfobacterium sp.]